MKTFWLYFGKIIVASVRCRADATDAEVIRHALRQHNACPTVSALHLAPFEITRMIHFSTIRTQDVQP